MFNNYAVNVGGSSHTSSTNINAVSGTVVKNHPYSFFKRFHLNSEYAKKILGPTPMYTVGYSDIKAVVLQIMVVGDMEVVAEIVDEGKYDFPIEHLERENTELTERIERAIENENSAREDYDYLNEYTMKLEKMVKDLENDFEVPSGIFVEEESDDGVDS